MKRSLVMGCSILLVLVLIAYPVSAQTVWHKYAGNPVMEVGVTGSWDYSNWELPSVINNGSNYEMWYSGFGPAGWQIGHATSPDGLVWAKDTSNPVLQQGGTGTWDENGLIGPTVLFDGSTYKMWYYGKDVNGVLSIGYATSTDGVNWTKYANNPIIEISQPWEGASIGHPMVIFDGISYKMWYMANMDQPSIGYATSDSGITWIKYENNPVLEPTAGEWDFGAVAYPNVIFENDLYHLWYTGFGNGGAISRTWKKGYATSANGINWTKHMSNPVLTCGPARCAALGPRRIPLTISRVKLQSRTIPH